MNTTLDIAPEIDLTGFGILGSKRGVSHLAAGRKAYPDSRLLLTFSSSTFHPEGRFHSDLELHSDKLVMSTRARAKSHSMKNKRIELGCHNESPEFIKAALLCPFPEQTTNVGFVGGHSSLALWKRAEKDIIYRWEFVASDGTTAFMLLRLSDIFRLKEAITKQKRRVVVLPSYCSQER